jgi:putative FmdB family regulatory protein
MIYEFKCECGHIFEEIRPLKENTDNAECPKCNKKANKIPSIFGFKVNGFAAVNGYSHGNV